MTTIARSIPVTPAAFAKGTTKRWRGQGLSDGTIAMIATDHAPHTPG